MQGNPSSNVKNKQVQLPDVTGLTVAIESPAKGQSHQPYEDTAKYGDEEGHGLFSFQFLCPPTQNISACLQLVMILLQKRIAHLDTENHMSRKRMKELERELDVCRQDVERQRELVMHREEILVKQRRAEPAPSNSKGKARSVDDTKEEQKRYKQAVEEKKGSPKFFSFPAFVLNVRKQPWNPSLLHFDLTCPDSAQNCLRIKYSWTSCALCENAIFVNLTVKPKALGAVEDSDADVAEREQAVDESLNAQRDAKDYEIKDIQPALTRRALLERTTAHTNQNSSLVHSMSRTEMEQISVELEERCSERSRSSSRLGSSVSSKGSHRAPVWCVVNALSVQHSDGHSFPGTCCHSGRPLPVKMTSVPFIAAPHAGFSSPCADISTMSTCPRAMPCMEAPFPSSASSPLPHDMRLTNNSTNTDNIRCYYVDSSCRRGKISLPVSIACTSIFAYSIIKIAVPTSISSHPCKSFKLTNPDVSWVTRMNPFFFSKLPNGPKMIPS